MPPSKRAAPRPQETPPRRREPERQVGVHVHNGRRTPRVARVAIYDRHIEMVLAHAKGNKSEAARILGIARTTLDRKLASYGM